MLSEIPPRQKCIVVSVEAPWPTTNGGRARTSQVVRQLATVYDVTVIYPARVGDPLPEAPLGVNLIAVESTAKPNLTDRLGAMPRLGKVTLRAIEPELRITLTRLKPEFVYWSHSYLAAVGMKLTKRCLNLVEFANIEGHRSLSLSRSSRKIQNRLSALVEYFKSLWWERRCARLASVAVSLHHQEAVTLQRYGANVILVPNGFSQREYVPSSSETHRVLAMGSWNYGPNRTALESFLRKEWPAIAELDSAIELVIAGPHSEAILDGKVVDIPRVYSLGFVEDLSEAFQDCFCFLAPASSGGGSQLKVAEALSHHRIVVGPEFLRRELAPGMPSGAILASNDIVMSVISLAQYSEHRHSVERDLRAFVSDRAWSKNFTPVHDWLRKTLSDVRS